MNGVKKFYFLEIKAMSYLWQLQTTRVHQGNHTKNQPLKCQCLLINLDLDLKRESYVWHIKRRSSTVYIRTVIHTVYIIMSLSTTCWSLFTIVIVLAPCFVVLFYHLSLIPHEHKHKVHQSPILSAPYGIHVHWCQ